MQILTPLSVLLKSLVLGSQTLQLYQQHIKVKSRRNLVRGCLTASPSSRKIWGWRCQCALLTHAAQLSSGEAAVCHIQCHYDWLTQVQDHVKPTQLLSSPELFSLNALSEAIHSDLQEKHHSALSDRTLHLRSANRYEICVMSSKKYIACIDLISRFIKYIVKQFWSICRREGDVKHMQCVHVQAASCTGCCLIFKAVKDKIKCKKCFRGKKKVFVGFNVVMWA